MQSALHVSISLLLAVLICYIFSNIVLKAVANQNGEF